MRNTGKTGFYVYRSIIFLMIFFCMTAKAISYEKAGVFVSANAHQMCLGARGLCTSQPLAPGPGPGAQRRGGAICPFGLDDSQGQVQCY